MGTDDTLQFIFRSEGVASLACTVFIYKWYRQSTLLNLLDSYCPKGKSGNMLQFKKSSDPDFLNYKHIDHLLNLILKEQVNQRLDLSAINAMIKRLQADSGTQRQVDDFYDETSPQTDPDDQKDLDQLVIKTAVKPGRPKLPSKRPFGAIYDVAKEFAKEYGYYESFKQYDPGYYIDKYTYKPHKRVAGYLGQVLHKRIRSPTRSSFSKYSQQYQERNIR